MVINTPIVTILALFCYLVLPLVVVLVIKDKKTLKVAIKCLLIVYLCILIIGVWARVDITREAVKISFDYSKGWANKSINWGFYNLKLFDVFVNLILLVPLGLSYAILLETTSVKTIITKLFLLGFFAGFIIEVGQYILPVKRSVQLSDVVFNTISVVIGGIIGVFYKRLANKRIISPKQN